MRGTEKRRFPVVGACWRWPVLLGIIAIAAAGCGKRGSLTGSANASGSSENTKAKTTSTATINAGALNAMVGKEAPAWELRDHTGKLWKLSDLRGNVVVLITWATW